MSSPSVFALVMANLMNLGGAAVCIVCLVMILRSATVPADAARIGAVGFACLLLEMIVGIGAMVMTMTMRDSFESMQSMGQALAGFGILRLALQIAGLVCIARAIVIGRARAQASA